MSRVNVAEELLAMHLTERNIQYERQYHYIPGRRFRADFALPSCRILIGVEGGVYTRKAHGSVTGILMDMERTNLATLHGWRWFRFTPDQVESGEAIEKIAEVVADSESFVKGGSR